MFHLLLNQLQVQHLVCKTVAPHYLDMCGKLPGTLTLVIVSSAEREREIKSTAKYFRDQLGSEPKTF